MYKITHKKYFYILDEREKRDLITKIEYTLKTKSPLVLDLNNIYLYNTILHEICLTIHAFEIIICIRTHSHMHSKHHNKPGKKRVESSLMKVAISVFPNNIELQL